MPMPRSAHDVETEELAVYVRPEVEEQPEEELQQARKFLKECSDNAPPAAHLRLSRACLATDRLDEARKEAGEAVRLCKESGDSVGLASAQTLMCDVHLQALETDDAIDIASTAVALCNQVGDTRGLAIALSRKAVALSSSGEALDSLQTANEALKIWRQVGDPGGEVEALIVEAEAQVAICEQRAEDGKAPGLTLSHWRTAELAVRAAETWRSRDHACLGNALYAQARVCQYLGKFMNAQVSAKAAAKAFRKAGQIPKRAQALILCAEADMERGYLQDARSNAMRALDIFERLGDEVGLTRVSALYDSVDRKLGIPTRAEIEAYNAQMALQAQQQMMQQQQGIVQYQQQPVEVDMAPPPKPKGGGDVHIVRDGVPLDLGAMLNQEAVEQKILELVKSIGVSAGVMQAGDAMEIELDLPLMEAGVTSQTAVVLRDLMTQDLPGINLPPTLIFDYPSVMSIAEFVVEKAGVVQRKAAG